MFDLDLLDTVDTGSFDLGATVPALLTTCLLELVALFKPKAAVLVADAGRVEGLLVVREILVEDDEEGAGALEILVEVLTTVAPPEVPPARGDPEVSFTFRFNFPGLTRSIATCCLFGELGCCNFEYLMGEDRTISPGCLRFDCGDALTFAELTMGLVGVRAIDDCLLLGSR
jgi:hypothetical protein